MGRELAYPWVVHGAWQDGYDHSYFFISSFMDDHINFHADALTSSD
jgi:S-formylglutathione hydrolase FrmB